MNPIDTLRHRSTILIIDDVPANLDVLVAHLQEEEMDLNVALSGEDGLRLAREIRPDLILLDIMMPGIDGFETCKRLKAHRDTADIPIVFLTAKEHERDIEHGLVLGAVDYIIKPFSMPILKARLRNHLALQHKSQLLVKMACTDELTRTANRRHLDNVLEREWSRAQRNSLPMSLVMIDVDHFKLYNDRYGHPEGDRCLKQIARTLSVILMRPGDLLARYGGEEFAALLPETDAAGAKDIAERMRTAIEQLSIPHANSPSSKWVNISLGLSTLTSLPGMSKDDLLSQADQALYRSKTRGRNRLTVYDPARFCQATASNQTNNK